MASKLPFTIEEINNIINLYTNKNMSSLKIAELYNCNSSTILRLLKRNGVTIRSQKDTSKKCVVDESFFVSIDTEEKAYWLGFLYADGCVRDKYFGLKLSIVDLDHLKLFQKSLKCDYKIIVSVNKNGYGKGNKYCAINIYNNKMVQDLIKLGCMKNKTKLLEFPNEIIPATLMRHFIRGYFDGDGSIYYTKTKKYNYISPMVSFTGRYNFLLNLKEKLIPESTAKIMKYKNKDIYYLILGGINYIQYIYNYFYIDSTFYLNRKKEKFEEIIMLYNKRKAMIDTLNEPMYDGDKFSLTKI